MEAWESAVWGLAGGGAAGIASLMLTVSTNGFKWWDRREFGPRLFVLIGALLLGALVAAAASSEMSGPWPAFVIGIGAPSTIRGLLSGVEVTPAPKPTHSAQQVTISEAETLGTVGLEKGADESVR